MSNEKIVVMGGCGHVGLPLSLHLAIAGFRTVAVDINAEVVAKVNGGQYPFVENNSERFLRLALKKGFRATLDSKEFNDATVVVIITGMDVDPMGNPDLAFLTEHLRFAVQNSPANSLLLLRSTLCPGTMELLKQKVNEWTGKNDAHLRLTYCPERIAEIFAFDETSVLPQIISAFSEQAYERAWSIFSKIVRKGVRLSPVEAEYTKLITNAWRYGEFALSNYFYSALQKDVDFYRVLDAVKFEYPRASGFKTPGFACGPCLLKDTKMLTAGGSTSLGTFTIAANEGLPAISVDILQSKFAALKSDNAAPHMTPLYGRTVGILGMTFKADVDDTRCSLSYKVRKLLLQRGAKVLANDPYLPAGQSVPLEELLEKCDGFILATPHKCYKGINTKGKPFVDVWGTTREKPIEILTGKPEISLSDGRPTVLVTGSSGFIAGYVVQELLNNGFHVIGVDNFSKYGPVAKDYDNDPHYEFYQGDAKDSKLMNRLALKCDYILACAAMIGGISYFHEFAYDLLAENDRIIASTFDAAIHAFKNGHLKKIVVLSSSMVFESATTFPTKETEITNCPPPMSTYGFQKLACEYYAKGAFEQYGLPYTIVRPFNCVGLGERRALCDHDIMSGNIKLAMSHVVPDLMQKVLKGQDPLRILGAGNQIRHYTYGGDLARGIRICIEHPNALNEDFNISTTTSTSVLELAEKIWNMYYKGAKPFRYESDQAFKYDVQCRIPDCTKAKEMLGYEANTTLDQILEELFPWIEQQIKFGNL